MSVNKSVTDYYKMYGKMQRWNLLSVSSFNLLFRLIRQNALVLDVGCGIGYLSRLFSSYVGLDVNGLKIARELFPTTDYVCASATHLPFRDNSFDVCIAYDCIEHINSTGRLLSEMARVSNKIFVGCVDFQSWYQIVTRTIRLDRTHVFLPSREGLIKIVSKMLKIQKVYTTCGIFYLPRKLNRFFARFFPEYVLLECGKLGNYRRVFSE
jgi:ubiquinone/menaquinone biosynthesis C-methylase UbiE